MSNVRFRGFRGLTRGDGTPGSPHYDTTIWFEESGGAVIEAGEIECRPETAMLRFLENIDPSDVFGIESCMMNRHDPNDTLSRIWYRKSP